MFTQFVSNFIIVIFLQAFTRRLANLLGARDRPTRQGVSLQPEADQAADVRGTHALRQEHPLPRQREQLHERLQGQDCEALVSQEPGQFC